MSVNSVGRDITGRKRTEAQLQWTNEHFALAQTAARLGVWDCDLRTNITVFSAEYALLYGLQPNHPSLPHEEWLQLIHPSDRARGNAVTGKHREDTFLGHGVPRSMAGWEHSLATRQRQGISR